MQKSKISRANCPCPSCIMFKKLIKSILIGGRRGYAERPSSKKVAALKRNQETKEVPLVEIKLPAIGEALKNVNFSAGQADPVLLPDSSYPDWIFKARGPCRAVLRSQQPTESIQSNESNVGDEVEKLAQLKKFLRAENRKLIRKNNQMLKSASQ